MANISRTNSAPIPATGNPYSQATRCGDLVFVSGQVAFDAENGRAVEGGFEVQARKVFENLSMVLKSAGASLESVLKTTCFLADIRDESLFNDVYREFFPGALPARSMFQVGALSRGLLLEVEAVATADQP
jgi:2-iminobutanoate/2-iminopropanoate deaminase